MEKEKLIITEENKHFLPVEYFSASSIMEFLSNPYSFYTKYILYDWEDKKGVALFIGSACHFALEQYYNMKAEYLAEIDPVKKQNLASRLDQIEIQNIALGEFTKMIARQEKKGLEEMCQRKKINFETFLDHYENLQSKPGIIEELETAIDSLTEYAEKPEITPEEFEKVNNEILEKKESITKLKDFVTRAKGFFKKYEIDDEKLEYYKALYIDYGVIKTDIKTKKEIVINDAQKKIIIAINNYFAAIELGALPDYKPFGTEVKVMGKIEKIPVPLKGSMDLLAHEGDEKEGYPIDHKIVSSPTKPEVEEITLELENGKKVKIPNLPANYIIQAGVYRILGKEFLGYKPKKVVYDEILKSMPNPASGLLKKDLIKLLEDNEEKIKEIGFKWNTKTKNEDMTDALVEAGILKAPAMVNRVIIDFEKYPELDQIFLELYRRILNQIGVMSIYDLPLDFLPNFKADFSGAQSWVDFSKNALEGKDWKKTAEKGESQEEVIKDIEF